MQITNEMKVMGGVLIITALIIVGGAMLAGRGGDSGTSEPLEEHQVGRLVREDDSILGPEDAKVTIVEFGDFQCPACGALHPIMTVLREQNADKSVRFVYRNFPLQQHQFAQGAAEAALEAQAQGKFWEYHDRLFEEQPALDRPELERYATELGLDIVAMQTALDEGTHREAVLQDRADGVAVGVNSTPTLFINDRAYNGPRSVEGIQAAIDEILRNLS